LYMAQKIVVVHGASGHLGRNVVDALIARGHPKSSIVTPVRKLDADGSKALSALGVNVVQADLMNKDSLIAAYKGAHTIILIPIPGSNIDRIVTQENSIAAAQAAKVSRFVAVSAGNGSTESEIALTPAYLHLDSATRVSGLPWLVLRMGLYAENQEGAYKAAAQSGVLALPAQPDWRVPYIPRRDIAGGVAAAVLKWDLTGRVFDLEGSASVSFSELAAAIGKISGKTVAFKPLTVEQYADQLKPYVGAMAGFYASLTHQLLRSAGKGEFRVTNDLYELTGKTAEPFESYLTKILK